VPSFGNFLGRSVSEAAGFGAGIAIGPALHPVVQEIVNRTWALHPDRPLNAAEAAAIVAEAVELTPWGVTEASQTGVNEERFNALLGEALNAPGLSTLFELWRRNLIPDARFVHGLRKAKLEGLWDGPLEGLKDTLLSSEELAMLQQQGFVSPARANSEGALQGVTEERQQLRFEASGLPPGIETALQMLRRSIITEDVFAQIVREGHTKTKYTDELLALRQPVLSAAEYATLHLKGWISEAEMNDGGALTGYTPDQMHLLYLGRGRPAAPGQLWTAAAREIDGPAGRPLDEPQFIEAIKQSDIRPEYGPLLWAIRYLYPPLFQITRLVQGGAIDAATAVEWAKKDRYAPEVVTALEAFWSKGATGTADPHVTKAENQLWTALHKSYVNGEADDATATDNLTLLGAATAVQPRILELWQAERALIRKQLTPAQIKRAFTKAAVNEQTGQPWTRDEAIAALIALGYSPIAAGDFLNL